MNKELENKAITLTTGFLGAGAVEATPVLAETLANSEPATAILQVLIQIAIGVITLWRLVKKPKP